MDGADASTHYEGEITSQDQLPSLLTIVLDTHPAAWALLDDILPLSSAITALLVFINAHLASNYTNRVAVVASHCDRARWLYPTPISQEQANGSSPARRDRSSIDDLDLANEDSSVESSKRQRPNGAHKANSGHLEVGVLDDAATKYRPFALIEQELTRNLALLLSSTTPSSLTSTTSTKIAGALSLALSYIHRLTQERQEAQLGREGPSTTDSTLPNDTAVTVLQSRILLITLSPSADLAHQYIPIMNSIFACQRQAIPIDVLQLPLPLPSADPNHATHSSTVFLQQAADATHGIFIPAHLTLATATTADESTRKKTAVDLFLTYLLSSFSTSPLTRASLILPTKIDVDFRAACFCHRNVISTGYVCSICLSIFCEESVGVLSEEGCLTCGTQLNVRKQGVGSFGMKPVVVARRRRRRQQQQRS